MQHNGAQEKGRSERGPLTGITAARVEVAIQQLAVETISWAERLQDPNPPPVASLSGTLGDFDPDSEAGREKRVYALRALDVDEAVLEEISAQVKEVLRNNGIAIWRVAPHMFRIQARTIHEAGRSHQAVLVRFECLRSVRLPQEPPLEIDAVIWAAEQVSWDDTTQSLWPTAYVQLVLTLFLREFYRQKLE